MKEKMELPEKLEITENKSGELLNTEEEDNQTVCREMSKDKN